MKVKILLLFVFLCFSCSGVLKKEWEIDEFGERKKLQLLTENDKNLVL